MPPHDTAGGGRRKRPFPAAFCSHKPLFFQKGTCYTQIKWMRLPHREAAAEKNEVFCMIIQNALVYTPRHTFERGTLFIRNGRIVPFAAPEAGEEVIDAEGLYALPGLVDIHFHGAMGKDFCDGTEEAIQTLADFEASKGVLAICPATMTYPEEFLNHVMDAAAAHKNGKGADLVGINMEGPFISPKKVGAQNPEYVQGADAGMFRRLQKRAGGLIKLVDVAPEEPGNLDFIKECHNEVRISIAHTCTDYDLSLIHILIEQELLDKPRDRVIIHMYLEPGASPVETLAPVSYTHLDVYKRQLGMPASVSLVNSITSIRRRLEAYSVR